MPPKGKKGKGKKGGDDDDAFWYVCSTSPSPHHLGPLS